MRLRVRGDEGMFPVRSYAAMSLRESFLWGGEPFPAAAEVWVSHYPRVVNAKENLLSSVMGSYEGPWSAPGLTVCGPVRIACV